MRMGSVLAFFLLTVSLSFSAPPDLPELGILFIGLVTLVSVVVVALGSMVGNALQIPSMIAWSKQQVRELTAGVILAVLIWAVVTGSSNVVGVIFLQEDVQDVPSLGAEALDDHLVYMEELYIQVTDAYQTVGIIQGLSYFASAGGFWVYGGQGESPYFGASVLLGPLGAAGNNLTIQILTFRLIKIFAEYVSEVFIQFILPIALAFRIFPFTRRMGNTLIAISLGAIFIFPLSMMFVNEFWHAADWVYKPQVDGKSFTYDDMDLGGVVDGVLGTIEVICGSVVIRTFLSLGEIVWSLLFAAVAALMCLPYGYAPCFVAYFQLFFWEIWPLLVTFIQIGIAATVHTIFAIDFAGSVAPGMGSIVTTLLPAVMEATGFSIISLLMMVMITFSGIKSISVALGGEYVLYGVSRFV